MRFSNICMELSFFCWCARAIRFSGQFVTEVSTKCSHTNRLNETKSFQHPWRPCLCFFGQVFRTNYVIFLFYLREQPLDAHARDTFFGLPELRNVSHLFFETFSKCIFTFFTIRCFRRWYSIFRRTLIPCSPSNNSPLSIAYVTGSGIECEHCLCRTLWPSMWMILLRTNTHTPRRNPYLISQTMSRSMSADGPHLCLHLSFQKCPILLAVFVNFLWTEFLLISLAWWPCIMCCWIRVPLLRKRCLVVL